MKVCIVTEGTAKTGYGHLTRCLAIYQGFEEKNIAPTFIANCDEDGKQVLENIQIENFDWIGETSQLLRMIHGSDIIIIDSYLAELALYEKISKVSKKCVYLDDTLRLQYPPGVIINGAVGAEDLDYQKYYHHQLLLGLEYASLRKVFWDIPGRKRTGSIANVLVAIGATDTLGITFKLLEELCKISPSMVFHVILGYEDYYCEKKKSYYPEPNILFYHLLNAAEMCELMQKCHIAISAAGQTTYELARVGTKMILIKVAENQKHNLSGWMNLGYIDKYLMSTETLKITKILKDFMSENRPAPPRISGNGVRNIIQALTAGSS